MKALRSCHCGPCLLGSLPDVIRDLGCSGPTVPLGSWPRVLRFPECPAADCRELCTVFLLPKVPWAVTQGFSWSKGCGLNFPWYPGVFHDLGNPFIHSLIQNTIPVRVLLGLGNGNRDAHKRQKSLFSWGLFLVEGIRQTQNK